MGDARGGAGGRDEQAVEDELTELIRTHAQLWGTSNGAIEGGAEQGFESTQGTAVSVAARDREVEVTKRDGVRALALRQDRGNRVVDEGWVGDQAVGTDLLFEPLSSPLVHRFEGTTGLRVAWSAVAQCPDPEVLDAFVRGTLPWGTRLGIEGHMDTCSECTEVVSEMARLFASSQVSQGAAPRLVDAQTLVGSATQPAPDVVHVGRYQLGRRLGSGAMGMVFEAHDPQLHRSVAIKLLHPHIAEGPEGARLLREARSMAQLAHPNVVTVHDAGRAGRQVFVAMERVDGVTLGAWLKQKPRGRDAVLKVFVQAGRGLEAAHAVGIVHRDFKPENVMLGSDGRARVADFGLARPSVRWVAGQDESVPAMHATMTIDGLTREGAVVGTPAYMAPEQWNGALADARSDQFAFCVALYEAIVGRRPFEGRTLPALATAVTHGRLQPMPRSVPGWLREALQTGLRVEPQRRHPSMSALLRVLERDRGLGRRSAAVVGAMAIGAAATVGVLRWMAKEAVAPPASDPVARVEPVESSPAPSAAAPGPDVACDARAETVDGAWNEPRRVALIEALRRTDERDDVESRTVPLLDRWARDYAELARPLCDPSAAPDLAPVQTRCLARARAEFDALVATATQQNAQALGRAAASAAYRLPDVAACGRQPRLLTLPQPAPTTQLGRVKLAAADIAGARALGWLGSVTKARTMAAASVEQARAIGHGPLLADALLAQGEILEMRYEVDEARESLLEAVTVAEAAEVAWVRGRAATHLLRLHGAAQTNVTNIERWRRVTGAFVERLGDPFVTAEVMLAEADAVTGLGEFDNARSLLESTLALHEELHGRAHPAVAGVHIRQATVALALGTLAEAGTHAQAALNMSETTLGRHDLQTVSAVRVAGRVALAEARLEDAEALARRSVDDLALFSTPRHDLDRGTGMLLLGDVLTAQGERDAAQEVYEKAKVLHYVGRWRAYPLLRLSSLARTGGDTKRARDLAREGLAILEAELEPTDVRLAQGLRALADAQREHGDLDGARQTLRAVLALVDAQVGFGPLKSRCLHDLAVVEVAAGDREAALKLRDDAHVPFSSAYGQDSPQVIGAVLIRADLAWEVGKRDYARRLYGSVARRLGVLRGEDDDATTRARRRGGKN